LITGVKIKELVLYNDERGFFCELIRKTDSFFKNGFGQLSYSVVFQGVAKAWHLHRKQTEWMCVVSGDIKLVLYDMRENSETRKHTMEILMGSTLGLKVVRVPHGIAHGYKVINGPMSIVYISDKEYDPSDELRLPHDDPRIGYNWAAIPPIK